MASVRSIFVTGANQGLGMYTVHQLSKTPGVLLFMCSRRLPAAKEARAKLAGDIHPTSTVVPLQLDITDAASVKAAAAFVGDYLKREGLGGLDVLINKFVCRHRKRHLPGDVRGERFGTIAITEAMRPLLKDDGGLILNVSSILGSITQYTTAPLDILPEYGTTKSALNSLTVQWAAQEKERGTNVAVCPGHNKTNLNNFTGTILPEEGCMIIVQAALEKEGRTAVFYNKDGDLPW
ncbi:short-chain dehydrogenase/reductase SDR [Mycena rebaudengoi]|nr:short-chain dehydrogenase/reductase SDR [Mycena rebaudengoi]